MGILNNINYIEKAWVFQCQTPGIAVQITSGIDAAALTLINLVTFGCNDIMQARAGKFPLCARGVRIGPKDMWPGQNINKLQKIFKILEPAEKGLYWWMIADLATHFLANWTSLIYEVSACPGLQHQYKVTADRANGYGVGGNNHYRIAYSGAQETGPGKYFYGHGFYVPEEWFWQCTFTLETHPYYDHPRPGIELYLRQNNQSFANAHPCIYAPSLWFNSSNGNCHRTGQAPKGHRYSTYDFWYKMDDWGLASGGLMTLIISQLPIIENQLTTLGCFGRNITVVKEDF